MAGIKKFCFHTILVFSILFFILSLFASVTTPFIFGQPSFFKRTILILLAILSMILFHGIGTWFLQQTGGWSQKQFGLFLICLAFSLRLIYILSVNTAPVSDFLLNHESAIALTENIEEPLPFFYQIFTFRIGYPLWMSYLYRLWGNHIIIIQLSNLCYSIVSLIFLYKIAGICFEQPAARGAGLLFALWPSQILYCNVLASEHLFTALLLAAIYFGIQCYQAQAKTKTSLYCFLTALCLAFSRVIRPLTLFIFLSWGFILLYHSIGHKKALPLWTIYFGVILLYLFTFSVIAKSVYNKTSIDIRQSYSGFSLAVGLNYEERGVYNQKDKDLVNKPSNPPKQIDQEAKAVALQRVKNNGIKLVSLFKTKFVILWGSDLHGYNYGLRESYGKNILGNILCENQTYIQKISHIFYMYLLFFALVSFLYNTGDSPVSLFILTFFLLHVLAYSLLEAQSRYIYPAILFNIVLSGQGLACMDFSHLLQRQKAAKLIKE